jgi:hypothetical protein
MTELRWDRWNQRFDGTQLGPPGGALGRCGWWTNYACYRRQLNTESSPTALSASQTVTKQEAEGVFVFDQRALRHIGLYTAKPLPQRIESDQGHSRDNASAFRRGV